ncbi:MAG TPA: HAMP domain-containing protein, partial [bacterium]|nr:HAMP domain-containing protein [bacterium]
MGRDPLMRLGLRGEILVAFALVTLFAIGLNTLVVLQLDSLVVARERMDESRAIGRLAADSLGPARDAAALSELSQKITDLLAAEIVLPDGSIGAAMGRGVSFPEPADLEAAHRGETRARVAGLNATGGQTVSIVAPLSGGSALVLWREAGGGGSAGRRSRSLTLLYIALDALIAGSFGWYLVARAVIRPLRRVADATRRVAQGERDVQVPAGAPNELGDLARDFNIMITALNEKERQLASQVRELKSANESLRAAREEVVQSEKLASVGRLAAGVAHELGNPVGAVTGYVSAMLRGRAEDRSEDAEMLRRIDREMKRVDRIIRDLLDYARPRPPEREPIDLDGVVDAALAIVSVQKNYKSIQVERTREGTHRVHGDPHRLQQVLVNLLINAADAMENSSEKRVRVETFSAEMAAPARRKDDPPGPPARAAGIRVSDTGSGIRPEHLGALFDPFFTTK